MRLEFCATCGARLGRFAPCTCAECGAEYWRNPIPGASAFVEHDGRVLFMRRAHDPWLGYWEVPGGFCEPEEHPAETAVRELCEEAGLEIRVTGLLGMWLDTYGDSEPPDIVLSIYFLAEPVGSTQLRPTDEATELAWFTPAEIPTTLAFPRKLLPAIQCWRAQVGR